MTEQDFAFEADEIERHLEVLIPRVKAVIRQLRAAKTLGDEDASLVAQRARSLAEALDRADCRIVSLLRQRREAAADRLRSL